MFQGWAMGSAAGAAASGPSRNDNSAVLPTGVARRVLTTHPDGRGDFTELFRNEWQESPPPLQWNLSRNRPNVLRGVHVHAKHWDYLCVIDGEMFVGLHDLRPDTAVECRSALLHLSGGHLEVLAIPPGVAHGFYSPGHSTHVIGASGYYDPADHRRCRWDCPELALDWPCRAPELSLADRQAPGYPALRSDFQAALARLQRKD